MDSGHHQFEILRDLFLKKHQQIVGLLQSPLISWAPIFLQVENTDEGEEHHGCFLCPKTDTCLSCSSHDLQLTQQCKLVCSFTTKVCWEFGALASVVFLVNFGCRLFVVGSWSQNMTTNTGLWKTIVSFWHATTWHLPAVLGPGHRRRWKICSWVFKQSKPTLKAQGKTYRWSVAKRTILWLGCVIDV